MSKDGKKKTSSHKPRIPFSPETMNENKLKEIQFMTCSSGVSFDGDVVTDVVKTVLTESDMLQQSLIKAGDLGDYSWSSVKAVSRLVLEHAVAAPLLNLR